MELDARTHILTHRRPSEHFFATDLTPKCTAWFINLYNANEKKRNIPKIKDSVNFVKMPSNILNTDVVPLPSAFVHRIDLYQF